MHKRIKNVRKEQRLTQAQLGNILGLSRDSIANIENNRVDASDIFINLFCKEFNINKKWLLSEEGDKYINEFSKNNELITSIFAEITCNENPKLKTVIEKVSTLDEEYLDLIEKLIDGLKK